MTAPAGGALARLSRANPVREREVQALVPPAWGDELLREILAPSEGRPRPRRRPRARLLLLAAVILSLLVPTYAIGRGLVDGWLSGEPAPSSVAENFGSYAPELGFRPEPGNAVLVAADAGVRLYATTNDRASYCLATDTPDGGTCIPPAEAAKPVVAGIVTSGLLRQRGGGAVLVAGRVDDVRARAVRFADPAGRSVTRPVGASGFFLAALPGFASPCAGGDWTPTFEALGPDGRPLLRATIALASARNPGPHVVCTWSAPRG